MIVLRERNVSTALASAARLIASQGRLERSRAGAVLSVPEPVSTIYESPQERVLFCEKRDANPFFHLMESIWMLAGRQDARFLDRWVRDFSSRFAESDGNAHGAYGYRWVHHFGVHQILAVGALLHRDPTTRRAVIGMWNPAQDLAEKRDIPCNTLVMFRTHHAGGDQYRLDMTVCCRSNDMLWGAYGANAVHFSYLHEVVAGLAGMHVGTYMQVSNNLHVYTSVVDRMLDTTLDNRYEETSGRTPVFYRPVVAGIVKLPTLDRERSRQIAEMFLAECSHFCYNLEEHGRLFDERYSREGYISRVVIPMYRAHLAWREGGDWVAHIAQVESPDWAAAGREWIQRRKSRSQENQDVR